jgi:hypothetical protein
MFGIQQDLWKLPAKIKYQGDQFWMCNGSQCRPVPLILTPLGQTPTIEVHCAIDRVTQLATQIARSGLVSHGDNTVQAQLVHQISKSGIASTDTKFMALVIEPFNSTARILNAEQRSGLSLSALWPLSPSGSSATFNALKGSSKTQTSRTASQAQHPATKDPAESKITVERWTTAFDDVVGNTTERPESMKK